MLLITKSCIQRRTSLLKKEKIESFLYSISLATLTADEVDTMMRPITEEEIKENILRLKNNKSSGVDGLPGEYYKTLLNELTCL